MAFVIGDRIFGGNAATMQKKILFHNGIDLPFQGIDRKVGCTHDFDIHSRADRAVHFGACRRPEAADGEKQNELCGTHIAFAPCVVTVAQKADNAAACRHCLAHRFALGDVLLAQRNIV